jgi:hypothetical protein
MDVKENKKSEQVNLSAGLEQAGEDKSRQRRASFRLPN